MKDCKRFANSNGIIFEERIKDPAYTGPIKNIILISDETFELSRKAYDGELTDE